MKFLSFCSFALLTGVMTYAQEFTGAYPDSRLSDDNMATDSYFGTTVEDPYRWLEDDQRSETKAWIAAQNDVTQSYFAEIPFRDAIKERLTTLWNYERFSAPFKEGKYTYFFKNDGLQNQSVLYRQIKGSDDTEVFLDPNKLSKDGTTSLAGIQFSKDGSLCAFQLSEGGSDWRKVVILNTQTGKRLDDTLRDIKFSGIAWKGNEGFYYSSYDKPADGSMLSGKTQFHKLYYHQLGTPQSEDALIFGGSDVQRRYISASVTEDQNFLIIYAANTTFGNELYLQNLSMSRAPIMPMVEGFENNHSVVYSEEGRLFILTGLNAPNKKLVTTTADKVQPEHWKELIPESEFPMTVTACGGKLFVHYLKDAVSEVHQYALNGKKEMTIELPGPGTASGFSGKKEEQEVYYTYTSYIYPPTIFKYSFEDGESVVYKKSNVLFNPEAYETKQVFYTSDDGTSIPMIITHKKGLEMHGKNPVMLYGYGGFNVSLTPSFSISNIVFMENGGVYAVANLRGGGEYGHKWHEAGTKMQKQNVFNDFIAAANYLITEQYTSRDYLAIAGGSNGGLLVGACMTQQPELFRVCFPAVGVLDMLRYHKFTAGAGWAYDYGTADDNKEMFDYLLQYSPLHNVREGTCYPATLITTADHDDRVVPAHSYKFAATLQQFQGCPNPAFIRIDTKAGHGAGKPTDMVISEQADKWAFLFYNMGLEYNEIAPIPESDR